jgi:hypothetical protein
MAHRFAAKCDNPKFFLAENLYLGARLGCAQSFVLASTLLYPEQSAICFSLNENKSIDYIKNIQL